MAAARPYVPVVPCDVAFVSSKERTYMKEAYARTDQNSRNSFEIREEEIWRRRSLASIRSVISVLLIHQSNIIPLILDR
jgi:molybdopterin-guanine dinucleotide biosynthesis protein A